MRRKNERSQRIQFKERPAIGMKFNKIDVKQFN